MSDMNNLIQWPRAQYWDKAWNPIIGCKPCSPACENCYAAAMREALSKLIAYWDWNGYDAMRESRLKDMARAALSAPPRNCDRFRTAEEAHRMWRKYLGCHAILAQGWRTIDVLDWLFATATEQKGEGDEQK